MDSQTSAVTAYLVKAWQECKRRSLQVIGDALIAKEELPVTIRGSHRQETRDSGNVVVTRSLTDVPEKRPSSSLNYRVGRKTGAFLKVNCNSCI